MDRIQALTIFNIPADFSIGEITEHFENAAFAIYSPLFTQDPVPSLVRAKIKKLDHLQEGWNILSGSASFVKLPEILFPESADAVSHLEAFRKNLSFLRSRLSSVHFPAEAAEILQQMIRTRIAWDDFWVRISKPLDQELKLIADAEKAMKLSENVNVMEMMRILAVVEKTSRGDFNLTNLSNSQLELLAKERVKSIRILNNSKINE